VLGENVGKFPNECDSGKVRRYVSEW